MEYRRVMGRQSMTQTTLVMGRLEVTLEPDSGWLRTVRFAGIECLRVSAFFSAVNLGFRAAEFGFHGSRIKTQSWFWSGLIVLVVLENCPLRGLNHLHCQSLSSRFN
jgi:hypothetical protein